MLREIVFDTETTGLDPAKGDRLIEIGCIEIVNRIPTGREFHRYLNPERDIHPEAVAVHGLTSEFLKDKPLFKDVADEFLEFIGEAPLVAHNAHLRPRLHQCRARARLRAALPGDRIVDTLALARRRHPAGPNSLDALCKRYGIDLSQRTKHGALLELDAARRRLRRAAGRAAGEFGPRRPGRAGGDRSSGGYRRPTTPRASPISSLPGDRAGPPRLRRNAGRQGPLAALRGAGAAKLGHLKRQVERSPQAGPY